MIAAKSRTILTVALMVGVVAVTLATNLVPLRQIMEQNDQVAIAQAQLEELTAENELLTAEVEALQSPGEIERLAREKLGYVMEGETAYIVLPPEERVPVSTPETEQPVADSSWWNAVWEFITGADVADGS